MSFLFSFFFFFVYFFCTLLFFSSFFYSFLYEFYLFDVFGLEVSFSFVFDFLSLGFFSCVSFISFLVYFYSVFYMSGTKELRRFSYLVFFFVLSMAFLVFSGNFFVVMIGWDGLGLVSFCLVIFYVNSSSLESGLITVFSNRVGDVFFLLSFMLFYNSGNFSWETVCNVQSGIFFWLLIFGAITKSAQVPFSAWLPAAMAAPTPVSSLVHSSTLVTAGVYLLIRFNYILTFLNFSLFKLIFLFTMFCAGLGAIVEKDFKKIVAMSTLSQLGLMMYVLSLGLWEFSFLHMLIHAFFKSMLFLSTGSLIAQLEGSQDSRFFGGSFLSYSSFLYFGVSCFCLSGFPFFIGFYSKDTILCSGSYLEGLLSYGLFVVGCVFTVMYSFRLILLGFYTMFGYSSCVSSGETFAFFLPVSLLFFKCWTAGGVFYWVFLSGWAFCFTLWDLCLGLSLMVGGLLFFFAMRLSYRCLFVFSTILFLRWKSASGSSIALLSASYTRYEGSWMELGGGAGINSFLMQSSGLASFFKMFGMGLLILFFLFLFI